jgi:hypothetical protein
MAETLYFTLPAPVAGEALANKVLWFQSLDGETWDPTPIDEILVASLSIDGVSGKYMWASTLANPAKWHNIVTQSSGGYNSLHGTIVPPRAYQTVSKREINNYGAGMIDSEGKPMAGAKIMFQLVRNSIPHDAIDAIGKQTIVSSVITTTTNDNGEFAVQLWPTSRALASVKYRCWSKAPGISPIEGILPAGDYTPVKFADFAAGTLI